MIVSEEMAKRIADSLERIEQALKLLPLQQIERPRTLAYGQCQHCGSDGHHSLNCARYLRNQTGGLDAGLREPS